MRGQVTGSIDPADLATPTLPTFDPSTNFRVQTRAARKTCRDSRTRDNIYAEVAEQYTFEEQYE
jgi:hypothetical protein